MPLHGGLNLEADQDFSDLIKLCRMAYRIRITGPYPILNKGIFKHSQTVRSETTIECTTKRIYYQIDREK